MKILLIGATGMIGSRILAEAVGRGHTLIAATRHALKKADTSGKVTEKMLDATNARAIADAAAGADVIVSATSPRGGGDAIAEAAAVGDALIEAAGIASKRLFVVGGAGSLTLPDGKPVAETVAEPYRKESLGMRGVRDKLKASNINWTFFSPAGLISPGTLTKKYRLGATVLLMDGEGMSHISAEDYAHAVVDELERPKHQRAQFAIGY